MHNLPNMHLLINGECDIFTSRKTVLYIHELAQYMGLSCSSVYFFNNCSNLNIYSSPTNDGKDMSVSFQQHIFVAVAVIITYVKT